MKRIIILLLIIGFDLFLHIQDVVFGHGASHWFSLGTWEGYDLFWTLYWGTAFIITASLVRK